MLIRITTEPTHSDRTRRRRLAIYLSLILMPLTVVAIAQSPETAETPQEPSTEVTPEESLESGANSGGCPCCGQRGRGQAGGGGWQGGGRGQGRAGQGRGPRRPDAQVIHFLIENHRSLERTVEEIPGGVRTRTVSQDPEIIDAVRTHVRQMVDLIHGGGRIRNWDPLFREIFDQREAIEMKITDIDGGVEVTETSADEQVTKLIRAHAVKVEEFVARGLAAYQEETPLPAGYSDASP